MGQVLHGCARTTETVRRAIQNSQKSLKALSQQYGINPKTVAKWKIKTDSPGCGYGSKRSKVYCGKP